MLNLNAFLIKSDWEGERGSQRDEKRADYYHNDERLCIIAHLINASSQFFHSPLCTCPMCTDSRHSRTHSLSYAGRADTHEGKASNWVWLESWLNIRGNHRSQIDVHCTTRLWHASNALIHELFTPCIVAAERILTKDVSERSWAEMSRDEMRWWWLAVKQPRTYLWMSVSWSISTVEKQKTA